MIISHRNTFTGIAPLLLVSSWAVCVYANAVCISGHLLRATAGETFESKDISLSALIPNNVFHSQKISRSALMLQHELSKPISLRSAFAAAINFYDWRFCPHKSPLFVCSIWLTLCKYQLIRFICQDGEGRKVTSKPAFTKPQHACIRCKRVLLHHGNNYIMY